MCPGEGRPTWVSTFLVHFVSEKQEIMTHALEEKQSTETGLPTAAQCWNLQARTLKCQCKCVKERKGKEKQNNR